MQGILEKYWIMGDGGISGRCRTGGRGLAVKAERTGHWPLPLGSEG